MSKKIFVNLHVKDLTKTVAFFAKLGFSFNPQFTDENATCMIVSDDIFVMLLEEDKFIGFTKKAIPDTAKTCEAIISLLMESRARADELAELAFQAGATPAPYDAQDMGFMYTRSFFDLDGHMWEFFYMDESTVDPAGPS